MLSNGGKSKCVFKYLHQNKTESVLTGECDWSFTHLAGCCLLFDWSLSSLWPVSGWSLIGCLCLVSGWTFSGLCLVSDWSLNGLSLGVVLQCLMLASL